MREGKRSFAGGQEYSRLPSFRPRQKLVRSPPPPSRRTRLGLFGRGSCQLAGQKWHAHIYRGLKFRQGLAAFSTSRKVSS